MVKKKDDILKFKSYQIKNHFMKRSLGPSKKVKVIEKQFQIGIHNNEYGIYSNAQFLNNYKIMHV